MTSELLPGSSRWLLAFSYAMLVAGFTLISPLPCLLGVGSTAVSLPFRGFVVALSVVTLASAALRRQTLVLKFSSVLLFGLWSLLVMRLFFDLGVRHVATQVPPERYFLNAFGVLLLPMLVFLIRPCLQTMHLAWQLCFFSAAVGVAANLYVVFFSGCGFRWEDRLSTDVLNPISFGYLGSSLAVLGLTGGNWRRSGLKGVPLSALRGMAVVGGALVTLATGSKGPLVSLVLCVLIFALTQRNWPHRFGLLVVTVAVAVGGILAVSSWTINTDFAPIGRRYAEQLKAPLKDESSALHISLANDGWRQFVASPAVGSAMVELVSGDYPHNVVIEAFMATGVLGGLILLAIIALGVRAAWVIVQGGGAWQWAGLLYVQTIVSAMFSASLFLNGEFWAWTAAVVSIRSAMGCPAPAGVLCSGQASTYKGGH